MYVKVYLGKDLLRALIARTVVEARPLQLQVEVELRRAMGLATPPMGTDVVGSADHELEIAPASRQEVTNVSR